jgi:hypothetical protein
MNSFSLLTANRITHLKVVAVALVFATLVVGIGFAARVTDGSGTANATVVKPGKPVTATASEPTRSRARSSFAGAPAEDAGVSSLRASKARPPRPGGLCACIGYGVARAQQSESFDVVGRARI